jgi:murein DD-endopeptidase MepM/ murein hydrolase activator NlpD
LLERAAFLSCCSGFLGDFVSILTKFRAHSLARWGRYFPFSIIVLLLLVGAVYFGAKYRRLHENVSGEIHTSVVSSPVPIPQFREIVGTFKPHQTVFQALLQQGLSSTLANQIVQSSRPVYNLAKVKASQLYWVCFTNEGKFRDFRYPVDDEKYLTVYHDVAQDRFVPVMKKFQYEIRVAPVTATIETSLFASVLDIGEKDQLALDLADIFGSEIDFYTDIRKGDRFRLLVEKKYLNGRYVRNGSILAAAFQNQGRLFTGFLFQDENGKPAYYAPDGKSLKKSFLKSPLKFARITSKFSLARWHPILKILRPHLGVDYAAPVGTPVQAVGAGTVTDAGSSGGSGKMVRIRHAGGYETTYMHLSRIAVRAGTHVEQGMVVGYVGSTGLSTGPHLDFRVYRHGRAVNPVKVVSPPGEPVSRAMSERFAAIRDPLMKQIKIE